MTFEEMKNLPEKEQKELYKKLKSLRHLYKTCNYAATYGIGATKLSLALEVTTYRAKKILEAFWERNWAIREFSKNQVIKEVNGKEWILNPINNYWYSLKTRKDIFSAINQSTGAYLFTKWIYFMLKEDVKLLAQFHDEVILEHPSKDKDRITKILKDSINKVNKIANLNRDLDIDIQFGNNYGEIH